jgi:hypothetical protein
MQPVLKSLLLGLLFFVARLQAQSDSDEVQADIASQLRDKYLVILCAESDFTAAKREAERVSVASGVQFSMNGRVWDPNRGLILPDVCDDPVYRGEYLPRRYNELHLVTEPVGYISVEKSGEYPHLPKDYYIGRAAICDSQKELLTFARFAPRAHIAKVQIYMGCIH